MSSTFILTVFGMLLWAVAAAQTINQPPHIIVIIGDDIGWNDFSFHGSSEIPTPNIDALGYNGVFLNRFYTQPLCSPSRSAFLTGKYPIKYGYQGLPVEAGVDRPIPYQVELLPQKLKKLGYKTHAIGKWHLSAARKNDTPTYRGFDTHFGYWNGMTGYFNHTFNQEVEQWPGLDFHDGLIQQWEYENLYATDIFTNKSLDIIDSHNASEPLFLYLAHLAAHVGGDGVELGVPNVTLNEETFSYITREKRKRYAGVVSHLDGSVGQVVKKLKERGMLNNSVVVFFSDNGAQTYGKFSNHGSNYPLKGLKSTLLEGGVKGSAVVYSPLLEKTGYINNNLMHISDLHTTLLVLAGGDEGKNSTLDGINQWDTISQNLTTQRTEILLNIDEVLNYGGIISNSGRYKFLNKTFELGIYDLSVGDSGRSTGTPAYNLTGVIQSDVNLAIQELNGSVPLTSESIENLRSALDISSCNGKERILDFLCTGECLFDLWEDPCETSNLVLSEPDIADDLRQKLSEYWTWLVPQSSTSLDPNSNPKYCNDTWFPWLDEDGCAETQEL